MRRILVASDLMKSLFRTFAVFMTALFVLTAWCPMRAQVTSAAPATECAPMAVSRVSGGVDESMRVPLSGNVHPLARSEFDRGKVSDSLLLEHIILLLKRSPEQEVALQTRIDQMHNHKSPLFHKWLGSSQIGSCYGVADADIAAVTSWLQKHGFKIDSIPSGKTMILFTGTAGQVQEAFGTEIHNLNVKGKMHIANMSAPVVPAALAPVIAGFRSLHDFFPKPTMKIAGLAKRDPKTGKVGLVSGPPSASLTNRLPGGGKVHPDLTYSDGLELFGPQDFYTIYNENALLHGTSCGGSACNGAGQTIAVIEETDVCNGQSGNSPDDCNGADDLAAFRSQFGLPTASVNYMFGISSYCSDPGVQGQFGTSEESEADIDLQWAGAVAPGATVDFVACSTTSTTAGVDLAAMYTVNSLASTVSAFSLSYGICEAQLPEYEYGFGTNSFYSSLWEQAVAQGQTVLISAGDSGDDTCDRGAEGATSGWNVNGLASTPYNVAAGGTDFSDNYTSDYATPPTSYWNTNDTSPYGSALSYVPETSWNDTCGSTLVASYISYVKLVTYTPEQVCNGFEHDYAIVDGSGGGGISSLYSLPTWQSVYGVGLAGNYTSSSNRNLPDVALFAADGFWYHDLLFCESDSVTFTGGGTPCDYSNISDGGMMAAGGTSFVAPQLAGLMAVINQAWPSGNPAQPTRQGQANYTLYGMANYEYGTAATENTSTSAPSTLTCESNYLSISNYSSIFPSCVFYDIYRTPERGTTTCYGTNNASCLVDGNVMPCVTGDTDCYTETLTDAYGLLSLSTSSFEPAWYQSAGYSDAVGLGSFNITNLVNNWTSSTWITPFASTTTVSANPGTIYASHGTPSTTTLTATVTATGRGSLAPPLGTVSFYLGQTASGTCGTGLTSLGTSALVPASGCTTSCNATATLAGVTGSQLGGVGTPTVTACFSGDGANDAPSSNTTTVTVESGLVSIAVTPSSPSIVADTTQPFTATGTYEDSSTQNITPAVTWTSGTTSVATINTSGLATGMGVGTSSITATLGSVVSPAVTLTVTPEVTLSGDPASTNFGSVNICASGACNLITTLVYNVADTDTLGTPIVLTEGQPNLDFTLAGYTCRGRVTGGTQCIVGVAFMPQHPGLRKGAVEFVDGSGNIVGTTYIHGVGIGPQVSFQPGTQSTLGSGFNFPRGVAVDGSGNVYVADSDNLAVKEILAAGGYTTVNALGGGFFSSLLSATPDGVALDGLGNVFVAVSDQGVVYEIPPGCTASSCVTTLGGGFRSPFGIAVDGSGNVFVTDAVAAAVYEMPPGCASSGCVSPLGSGFRVPLGVAVDGSGNVYVADGTNNAVYEMTPGCASSTCVSTLGSGFSGPRGVAVDASGDVYVTDLDHNVVKEILAVNGSIPSSPTILTLASGFNLPVGIALDGSGNVYVGDANHNRVVKLDYADAPSLNFPTATTAGSIDTADGPQSVTVQNNGNAALVFSGLAVGANFVQVPGSGTPPDCTSTSSLATGSGCNLSIEFEPTAGGSLPGAALLSDNSLGGTPATQSIALTGTGQSLATTTVLAASSLAITQGDPILLTATVSASTTPTGSVTFYSGATPLGTGTLNGSGVATLITSALPLGSDSVTATYAGNAVYASSPSNTVGVSVSTSLGAPTVVSLSPTSGSDTSQTFTAVYSDPNGVADLALLRMLFNTVTSSAHACYVYYYPGTNLLYLENDDATGLTAGLTPGSALTVSNSQCTLAGTGSSYNASGTTATLNVALTFTGTVETNVYLYASEANLTGSNSGWVKSGTWGGSAGAPTVVSLSPGSGSGTSQTFTAVYSDPNGASDLALVRVLFNNTVAAAHACYVYYYPETNLLYLVNDGDTALSAGIAPGSALTVSNSQCTLAGTGSSYNTSGNTATLNVALTFTGTLPTNVYLFATEANVTASNSGWVKSGTWGASAGSPAVVSLTPNSGSGSPQTFTAVYSDPNGSTDLASLRMLFNTVTSSAHACYVYYYPGTNLLYLENDDATGLTAGLTPGSALTVSNSQCTLAGTGSSYTASRGSRYLATLNVALTFTGTVETNVYLYASEANLLGSNSGWVKSGTWGGSAGPPTVVSLTPNSGSGSPQTFAAVYSDPNGASDLALVRVLFNNTVAAAHACYVYYYPGTNLLYLANDGDTALSAGIALGSALTVSNSQCTLAGTGSSYNASGNTATLNVALTFTGTSPTSVYMFATEANSTASNSGWVKSGSWTP